MTQKRASELITENLTAIYGFAYGRLYEKDKVEDLASEIVCEILASVKNLEKEEAFWGFVWRIAENTFRKFIKREELRGRAETHSEEEYMGNYIPAPEAEYLEAEEQDEQIYLLRRELSLLSKTHREVCVAYYVDNKSCSEIAKEQDISLEMVKYHLFKTRKLLKEGIGMMRKLGEKSYNPGTFRLDFWGDLNHYSALFRRKLPGAIMLAAYYTPMSMEELSMELGVSAPYLEEELDTLEAAEVLTKVGNKYQTNLVIVTDAYEKEFVKNTASIYAGVAAKVYEKAVALLPEFRALDFAGNQFDDNRLLFAMLNIAMVNAFQKAKEKSPLGEMPKLALGGNGWIFGNDNDYKYYHFTGICMHTQPEDDDRAWFSAENYSVIKSCQHYSHLNFRDRMRLMISAIFNEEISGNNPALAESLKNGEISAIDGRLVANFPVFTSESYEKLLELLAPASRIVCDCMIEISERAAKILESHVPASVRSQCDAIAKIHHRLDVMALLIEDMVDSGTLIVPDHRVPLCIFAVKREK